METNTINLEAHAAEAGFNIAQVVHARTGKKAETENWINKSLAVLQEQGVYAFFLYLLAQGKIDEKKKEFNADKRIAIDYLKQVISCLQRIDFLKEVKNDVTEAEYQQWLTHLTGKVRDLCQNLDDVLLTRTLINQALIYARYHAKACEDTGQQTS